MKKLVMIVYFVVYVMYYSVCFAAGSAVYTGPVSDSTGKYQELTWTITCDAGGEFTYAAEPLNITWTGRTSPLQAWFGRIERYIIDPGEGVALTDSSSSVKIVSCTDSTIDFLQGAGAYANLSESNTIADGVVTPISGYVQHLHNDCVVPDLTDMGEGAVVVVKLLISTTK